MSFDRDALAKSIALHGPVARIVIADVQGSAPREIGAAMFVWRAGETHQQSGTIGGGELEFQASRTAFNAPRLQRIALGPAMGQCCGGSVTILTEVFETTDEIPNDVYARGIGEMPFGVQKSLQKSLAKTHVQGTIEPRLYGNWMIEKVSPARRPLWIWGAGHVGRALMHTLSPLPDFDITWIDTSPDRFPDPLPVNTTQLVAEKPELLVHHAPPNAEHLIVTFSHRLDLELCHRLLCHRFDFAGLIGSKTKWVRFRSRLETLDHTDAQISRISCPIGQPELGKHPQAIAVGVAAGLISRGTTQKAVQNIREGQAG